MLELGDLVPFEEGCGEQRVVKIDEDGCCARHHCFGFGLCGM
jgi:hypothetical protein